MLGLDLSNLKLAMFMGCKTGQGGVGGANLPTKAVEKGAKCAVGFRYNIMCDDAKGWIEDFSELIKDSDYTVEKACNALKAYEDYKYTTMTSFVLCGNGATTLN